MYAKKNPCKFNIQFDKNCPEHRQVVEILTAKGRNKAQYIANAILYFENNSGRNLEGTVTEIVTKILGTSPEQNQMLPKVEENTDDFKFSDIADALSGFKE